ncbi:putative tetratricopeptide-like helical domain, peroxisomal targeting signal 1 receptor family [Lupinus albus]|uniref:Putative tetratricopeptide-like helical domain, peroxisomal targeting signal 1 receptor family n=1 Tax=Lupinus albus TaxID=3870 RepID=A0A6A4PE87_LUPAL|nr:putative tetratricopeptide-like helical domain, peroxisomal targeting signal 1 receptor family [Lupinus albus]
MAMRDLVLGSTSCPDPSASSSSNNPLGALANALIGSSSKTQERLKEIPTSTPTGPALQFYSQPSNQLPGSELDKPFFDANSQGPEFLNRFRSAGGVGGELEGAWNEIQHEGRVSQHPSSQLDRLYDRGPGPQLHQPPLDGTPQRVLSSFLHSFLDSGRGGVPFHPAPVPLLGLSEGDKQCIRDRSSIMARHLFADKSEEFIDAQVNALLCSLDIDSNIRGKGHMPERFRELNDYWNESQGNLRLGAPAADGWITEYGQHRQQYDNPDSWANSFEQQHGANGWVSEFEHSQLSSVDQMRGMNMSNLAAMEQTRMLANTLGGDPKFQNSKFLQFVSKMSRGELIIDDNQVKETALPASGDWAAEYQQQYNQGHSWAGEFLNDKVSRGPDQWVNEFTTGGQQLESVDDQWVNDFSKLHVDDWADEFGQQMGEGVFGEGSSEHWAQAYDEYLNEQVASRKLSDGSRGVYVFSDLNPYVGHPNPLKEGQDLFRRGLLSEAVLALEAEVMKNPENAEGWRLLGIAHAENDDDQQAIAAMMRAQEADPTNLEVLLALGVSHTNELEQASALKYLYGWLHHHQKYGTLTPPEMPDSLYYADVSRLFKEAAQLSPDDADVHIVLGVLYNLSREYDKAIASFEQALKLKPQDYSLWNKLGATQANSVQSADAIMAYQQALDLKPNYVRAWANMGISYANQGMYEESIRYYVRALAMNPKAENAWQYLRISLSCASRNDLLDACDNRNVDLLQKEFPLQ